VVHALPVSAALGEAFPHLEITWVVEELASELVLGNPYLKEVIVAPRNRWKRGRLRPHVWKEYIAFLRGFRQREFDLTLDLQGYGKSAMIVLAARAPYRLGWWRLKDGSHLVSQAVPRRSESIHRVDCFLDVVRALGIEPETPRFPIAIADVARTQMIDRLCAAQIEPQLPFVVINPSGSNPVRRWSMARYANVATTLTERGIPCVLVGAPSDKPLTQQIIDRTLRAAPSAPLLDLAGQTGLKELAALLESAAVHVGGDTGSTHIAAAVGCPVVALYGPSDPAHAGPWGQQAHVLTHRDLCAARCSERRCALVQHSSAKSPEVLEARCMASLTTEETLARIELHLHAKRQTTGKAIR
jgi:ADP-heptose:LPS heptosyltransferase